MTTIGQQSKLRTIITARTNNAIPIKCWLPALAIRCVSNQTNRGPDEKAHFSRWTGVPWTALVAVLVLSPATVHTTFGQTVWTAGGGDWFDNNNWSLDAPNAASGTSFDAIIANGGTAQLQAPGGSVRRLRVGLVGGTGHLLIDGGTLNVTDDLYLNVGSAGPASAAVQNGSTVTAPDTVVGFSSNFSTSFLIAGAGTVYNATTSFIVGQSGAGLAALTVENGAVLASGTSTIGSNGFGYAAVNGTGSRWLSTGAFTVGSTGSGTLNIENQGVVHVGTTLSINSTSAVNLYGGGTLRFNTVGGSGGLSRLFYSAGTIQLAGNRDFASDVTIGTLFPSGTIPSGKKLDIEGNSAIQITTLSVDGGAFDSQGEMSVGSTLAGYLKVLNAGKVVSAGNASIGSSGTGINLVSGAGSRWTIGGDLSIGSGDLTIVNQGTVYVGGAVNFTSALPFHEIILNGGTLRFSSYSDTRRITYTAGTIQLSGDRNIGADAAVVGIFGNFLDNNQPTIPSGKQLTVEGTATIAASSRLTLSGGTLAANTMLMTPGGRLISTQPAQASGAMLALAGSVIDATGANLTVGDATKVNGFYGNGMLLVGQRTVTLGDANDAVLDSAALVTLGAGGSPGTLVAANGLTLDFGGNVTGFGTVSTPNNVAKPLINNGHITGDSAAQKITLPGYVKGVGTFDNVSFTGTFSPGLSPTISIVGSIAFSPTSTLVMELGGTAPGSGYDQILSSGVLALDGTLQISLLNGFLPAAGQSFNLFDSMSVSGAFSTLILPTVDGFAWNTSQLSTGMLSVGLPGDFNQNGIVDAADYVVWRKTDGTQAGYSAWRANFGVSLGVGSSAALPSAEPLSASVPEPATLTLLIMAMVVHYARRRSTVS